MDKFTRETGDTGVDLARTGLAYISSSHLLSLVRFCIFPDVVAARMPPGSPSAIIERRLIGGRLVEAKIPRWQIEELMRGHHVVDEQLPLF